MSLKSWVAAGASLLVTTAAAAQTNWRETVILNFAGLNGIGPDAGVVFDAHGNLFGTTFSGGLLNLGTVFKLTAPVLPQTNWTETVLHSFKGPPADGAGPGFTQLAIDASDNVFGTAGNGEAGGPGVIFAVTPPANGQTNWRSRLIYTFSGGVDGSSPSSLTLDAQDNLYGTTSDGGDNSTRSGTVFEVRRPVDPLEPWPKTTLFSFSGENNDGEGPSSGVIFDAAGNLYGETGSDGSAGGAGLVYRLAPPTDGGTRWTETVLYSFGALPDGQTPYDGLIFDAAGNLYGATIRGGANNLGTVFKLSPPTGGASQWTEQVLYAFTGIGNEGQSPDAVTFDSAGNLYGRALGGILGNGIVFQLTPPATGQTAWIEHVIDNFSQRLGLGGRDPLGVLSVDGLGIVYGVTSSGGTGGCTSEGYLTGCGTIYELKP